MNITSTNPNQIDDSTIIGGLQLELKQNVIEHKAEFDGRFFVKIFKDQLLEDTIIKPGQVTTIYTILDSRDIGYINQGTFDTAAQNYANNPPNALQVSGPAPGNYGHSGFPVSSGGNNGWDGGASNPSILWKVDSPSTRSFWFGRRGWFIDASNSYSFTWNIGGNWDFKVHKDPWDQGQGIWNGGFSMALAYTRPNSSVWSSGTVQTPSTGPWAGITSLDIFNATNLGAEVSFITRLKTVGTLWRWREDPDQHIYRTGSGGSYPIPGANHSGSNSLPFGKHGYNCHGYCASPTVRCLENGEWQIGAYTRTKFKMQFSNFENGGPMGGFGGPHNARYSPVNMPTQETYFSSPGVVFADQGTCSDTTFNNDETACLQAGATWTSAGLSNPAGNPPAPGIRCDGQRMYSNSNPKLYKTVTGVGNQWDWADKVTLQIIEPVSLTTGWDLDEASTNPAIWETEPKEDVGLDIYHEVGKIYPIEINDETNELFAPIGSTVEVWRPGSSIYVGTLDNSGTPVPSGTIRLGGGVGGWVSPIFVKSWDDNVVTLQDSTGADFVCALGWLAEHVAPGDVLSFTSPDGAKVGAYVDDNQGSQDGSAKYKLYRDVHGATKTLPWFNCYSFGNGVESDRIRDDYNQVRIDNGPKASTTLEEPYLEERRKSGLIYSGIYNSTSGINNLNQFIQAEKITKDLNPTYGSIQKLYTRDTDLVTFCEDKVLKILANKDALYEADGNSSLTATANVLGQTTPFAGEYGISKNPESFASESFRMYFTDKSRGVVLRLSQDGLTPISAVGMKDWFSDNLKIADYLIGSYDDRKSTYNLTLDANRTGSGYLLEEPITISFGEKVKGWPSFKSFVPELGSSFNNNYYTFWKGNIWRHHDDTVERNSFYDISGFGYRTNDSTVTVLLNEDPGTVKSFGTLNYEGSQARITPNLFDREYYNNTPEDGWYVSNIKTNLQEIGELEFKDKEDKWFSQIQGVTTDLSNVDTREFSVQGIDYSKSIDYPQIRGCTDNTTPDGCGTGCNGALNYNPNATIDDGSCTYCVYGCMQGSLTYPQIYSNYDPNATCSCPPISGPGGSGPSPGAPGRGEPGLGALGDAAITIPVTTTSTTDCCIPCVYGCTLQQDANGNTNSNYDPLATCDDGSCISCIYGCMNSAACNFDPLATCDDGSCLTTYGCMDPYACNYDPSATCDDGNCLFGYGCTDPTACNYNPNAQCDDGSCSGLRGCFDVLATNYAGGSGATCDCAGNTQLPWDHSCCDYRWECNPGTDTWESWYIAGQDPVVHSCYSKTQLATYDIGNYLTSLSSSGYDYGAIILDFIENQFFGSIANEARNFNDHYLVKTNVSSVVSVLGAGHASAPVFCDNNTCGCPINGPGTYDQGFAEIVVPGLNFAPIYGVTSQYYNNASEMIDDIIANIDPTVQHGWTKAAILSHVNAQNIGQLIIGSSTSLGYCTCTEWDGCGCEKDPNGTYLSEINCFTPCCG